MSSLGLPSLGSFATSGVSTDVALAMTKKVMETQEQQGDKLVESMQAMATGLGQNIDILA